MKRQKCSSGNQHLSSKTLNYHDEMMKQMKNEDTFYFASIGEIIENIQPELFCSWFNVEEDKNESEEF